MVFENLRQSLNDLMARATKPEERRDVLARMRDSLVHAKLGVEDVRGGVAATRARRDAEQRELETVRRRKALAEGIADAETAGLAAKWEAHHAERLAVLEAKLDAQERELALAERELEEMNAEFKRHAIGAVPPASAAGAGEAPDPLAEESGEGAREELDAMARERARAARDEDAARRLEELKRRMGKST
jgi:aryl-alcohol dehydrogenase-like predicted oxidoreductase